MIEKVVNCQTINEAFETSVLELKSFEDADDIDDMKIIEETNF